jgi:hypothetical protein
MPRLTIPHDVSNNLYIASTGSIQLFIPFMITSHYSISFKSLYLSFTLYFL